MGVRRRRRFDAPVVPLASCGQPRLLEVRQHKKRKRRPPRSRGIRRQPRNKLWRLHAATMPSALGGYALPVVRAADALTAARAVVALPVGLLVFLGHDRLAALTFAAGGLTDLLDGPIARRSGGTALGYQLDPLADKLLTDVTLLALAARGRVPWAVVA